jgi:mannose-6-phosphate isomerase-like protein (cupin superfamily)
MTADDEITGLLSGVFPAGTAPSRLTVYDWSGPDGLPGGSAHAHLACTEGYVVVGGRGRLQTLSSDGFAETPLDAQTVAWFEPGVIHRLVNDGALRIVVLMQNSGLPEAGDCVLTLPPDRLADPVAYREIASITDATDAETAARRRKDLSVEGFLQLREKVASEGPRALQDFYRAAVALTTSQRKRWHEVWSEGALTAARTTGAQLDALERGQTAHLHRGRLHVEGSPADRRFGMCGRLEAYKGTSGQS